MQVSKDTKVKILDIYVDKAQYQMNQTVEVIVIAENIYKEGYPCNVFMKITSLNRCVYEAKMINVLHEGVNTLSFQYNPSDSYNKGYGVEIRVNDQSISTAFDVLEHWSIRPRYGFLSDFYKGDEKDEEDVLQLTKYHINVVQFYDWMYKHEDLIPKKDYYVDLLGRELSKKAIEDKISACHKRSMAALGYGAIYAASKEFQELHKDWSLYTNNGKAQNLGDWFYIMNIAKESPWFEHIIKQFELAVDVFDFDGIHLDTYGFPKTAFSRLNGVKKLERLNEQFVTLIDTIKERLEIKKEEIGLILNAVSNWAIEEVAKSKQAVVYIEVWDPQDRYMHLYELICRGKELSNKQVILAAYLKCFDKKLENKPNECINSLLLTSSIIFASGGFHLLLGEKNGVLCDPYYVNHGFIKSEYEREVRNYYDFIVRYGELLFDLNNKDLSMTHANGINQEYRFFNGEFSSYPQPNKLFTVIKENSKYKIVHLVNLTGIESDIWNEEKKRPQVVSNIELQILIDEEVVGVYHASPDIWNGKSIALDYDIIETNRGNCIKFTVPLIYIWCMVYVEVV